MAIDFILPQRKLDLPSSGWASNRELVERLLYTDPIRYQHVTIDRYARYQPGTFTIKQLFQEITGTCRCGCGKPLTGRRTVWATDNCAKYGLYLYWVVKGRVEVIRKLLMIYQGFWCKDCGCNLRTGYELDHIVPVHKGGGGCWLSNYQLLCISCHKDKTKRERVK